MLIPDYIINITKIIAKANKEAYIVGGCVRDLLLGVKPKDWDITTNSRPEELLKILPGSKYENNFGTILVPVKDNDLSVIDCVEVTTYRSEQGYSDRRHPDKIIFEDKLEKDLARRDFTINAMALGQSKIKEERIIKIDGKEYVIIDLFGGEKDIKKRIIRAVGEPIDRFKEDALRMMRAIRLACQLDFEIEPKTSRAILKMAGSIKYIANERIKDELIKILDSKQSYEGIMLLHETKLLQYILPELERGVAMEQNRHHIYTVFNHSVLSLKHCPSKDWRVRLAALLHDVAKPQTKKIINNETTFYNHEILGAKITEKIMRRLKFSNADINKTVNLVKNHMFYYNVDEVTESSVRRLIVKAGAENLKDLIDLRISDRLGSGVPKGKPYKLRHLEYIIKKVQNDPVTVKMLKINGTDLMKLLNIQPSVKIGAILDVLLSEVIEDPKLNDLKYLQTRSFDLNKLELKELRSKAKNKIMEKNISDNEKLKKEFYV
jgi:tRNA nucleotidyltransferase (CCA-adding enzyme)